MDIKSIGVFCGARKPSEAKFSTLAQDCGNLIGKLGLKLVYGGANTGMMGLVSNAAYEAGAYVYAVYPRFLNEREPLSHSVSEMIIVDTMSERKRIMIDESDAFIILPGGIGTLDEFFEVLTLKYLDVSNKPIIIINVDNYWDPLNKLIAHIAEYDFIAPKVFDSYHVANSAEEALKKLGFKL